MCEKCFKCLQGSDQSRDESCDYIKTNFKSRTRFYCCGTVLPYSRLQRHRHGMMGKCVITGEIEDRVEESWEALESGGITIIDDPDVPHVAELPEQLLVGRAITILGQISETARWFTVNLSTDLAEDADVGLHFNARFDRQVVIRNNKVRQKWGAEEISTMHPFPFRYGKQFMLTIFVGDEEFLIAVNDTHFCTFALRSRLETLTHLSILGDVKLMQVKHYDLMKYPPQDCDENVFVKLPNIYLTNSSTEASPGDVDVKLEKIQVGSVIEISGRVKMLPQMFYINIQTGSGFWPHPLISLHINPRYYGLGHGKEQEMILNSWLIGCWGNEVVLQDNPFTPGKQFNMIIECKEDSYTILVNNKHLTDYKYRHNKLECDSLLILGDVFINKVLIT